MERTLMKTSAGIVQIVRCPRCSYMVFLADSISRNAHNDLLWETVACRWCAAAGEVKISINDQPHYAPTVESIKS